MIPSRRDASLSRSAGRARRRLPGEAVFEGGVGGTGPIRCRSAIAPCWLTIPDRGKRDGRWVAGRIRPTAEAERLRREILAGELTTGLEDICASPSRRLLSRR